MKTINCARPQYGIDMKKILFCIFALMLSMESANGWFGGVIIPIPRFQSKEEKADQAFYEEQLINNCRKVGLDMVPPSLQEKYNVDGCGRNLPSKPSSETPYNYGGQTSFSLEEMAWMEKAYRVEFALLIVLALGLLIRYFVKNKKNALTVGVMSWWNRRSKVSNEWNNKSKIQKQATYNLTACNKFIICKHCGSRIRVPKGSDITLKYSCPDCNEDISLNNFQIAVY